MYEIGVKQHIRLSDAARGDVTGGRRVTCPCRADPKKGDKSARLRGWQIGVQVIPERAGIRPVQPRDGIAENVA